MKLLLILLLASCSYKSTSYIREDFRVIAKHSGKKAVKTYQHYCENKWHTVQVSTTKFYKNGNDENDNETTINYSQ